MATPLVDDTDLTARLRDEMQGAGSANVVDDPLAADMREHAQQLRESARLSRMKAATEEARTDALTSTAGRVTAEAAVSNAEADKVEAEVKKAAATQELQRLEGERKVHVMMDQGIPEAIARQSLGLAQRGLAVQAVGADGSPTSVFQQFVDGMSAMAKLQEQMQAMAMRQYQSQIPTVANQPLVPQPSLSDEFRKMRELRTEVGNLAGDLGFISREQLAALAPQPPSEKETLFVDIKDLRQVPATMAVQIYEAQESAKARIYEIDKRIDAEKEKWQTLRGMADQFFSIFNFRDLGKALAAGPSSVTPSAAAPIQQQQPSTAPSGVLRLECGRCHQPSVFATREMVQARAQAACGSCGAIWDLTPSEAAPPPAAPRVASGQTNQNGASGDFTGAMAEILGKK